MSLSAYLLVRIIDQDVEEGDHLDGSLDVIVPYFWYNEGTCWIPKYGKEKKAVDNAAVASSWPSHQVQVLSQHSKYYIPLVLLSIF